MPRYNRTTTESNWSAFGQPASITHALQSLGIASAEFMPRAPRVLTPLYGAGILEEAVISISQRRMIDQIKLFPTIPHKKISKWFALIRFHYF
jgi:hypothetical protein